MKIELTETEIIHIMDSLRQRVNDLTEESSISGDVETSDLADELEELEHDLFEALSRSDDGWDNDPVPSAALDMIQTGIDGREQAKASSRAAQRREELSQRMMKGTGSPTIPDCTIANDPADW